MPINGILLIYHHPLVANASTIMEHVNAFEKNSNFKVWKVNTELGFPAGLKELNFKIIVLHYSLFNRKMLSQHPRFLTYIKHNQASYKIAFFQDEHRYWPQRAKFLNDYQIDCVYTLVEPAYFKDTYQKHTGVPKLVYNLTGYVSDDLVQLAQKLTKPDHERTIDISYRGRQLLFYMGKGSQEKHTIALDFKTRTTGLGLRLDIESEESKRIYGNKWYEFLANSRAVLGVEAGVSIFDIDNEVYPQYKQLMAENPNLSFEEVYHKLLCRYEDNIFYRTISPRHFEAAAFRAVQILFEGKYSGIMQPMVHYIPLKKDFSNFDDVLRMFNDEALRHELTENAYRDLIASGKYSYRRFIESFDQELFEKGFQPEIAAADVQKVTQQLQKDKRARMIWVNIKYRLKPLLGIMWRYPVQLKRHLGRIKRKIRERGRYK